MEASRTLNWYVCLCDVLKLDVKITRQVFYCHFQTLDTHLFYSFCKKCTIYLWISIWGWFWMSDKSFTFLIAVFFLCISTIAWNGKWDGPFQEFNSMQLTFRQPPTLTFALCNCLNVLIMFAFFCSVYVWVCLCVCVYHVCKYILSVLRLYKAQSGLKKLYETWEYTIDHWILFSMFSTQHWKSQSYQIA